MKKLLISVALLALGACKPDAPAYHGYVEGEYLYLAPTTAGVLESLPVQRGQQVDKGALLFALDLTALHAERLAAQADVEKAKANLDYAKSEYDRIARLIVTGAVSRSEGDSQRAAHASASATLKAAQQKLAKLDKQLAEAAPMAPAAGRIENTFFNPGEFVAAGTPVLSFLPPENVKIRFFVPQADLPLWPVGADLSVRCDGDAQPIAAKVSFTASQSEYTPPVIYSVGSRDKLVFMVEAKPVAGAACLRPGLPVDIVAVRP